MKYSTLLLLCLLGCSPAPPAKPAASDPPNVQMGVVDSVRQEGRMVVIELKGGRLNAIALMPILLTPAIVP
jgi:hypothetical protein